MIALVFNCAALAQDAKKKETDEDGRLNRIIERWLEVNETERDVVVREVGRGHNGNVPDDYNEWFTRLGGDDETGWDRALIQRDRGREIFDRIVRRIGLDQPTMTRDQFVGYARRFWRKDVSPTWRESPRFDFGAEMEQLFKRLDADRDGYLHVAEMAPALRKDLKRWDKNHDEWITLDEYRGYFALRLDKVYGEWQQKSERRLPPLEITLPEDSEKPSVIRPARLPTGLPAWFTQLDKDQDGQIGLYEWRVADWPLEEFKKVDLNDDGFLESSEVLRVLATVERDGSRPFAFLLQKRTGRN